MPGLDGTGPAGAGRGRGRGMGFGRCAGAGRGMGRGRGGCVPGYGFAAGSAADFDLKSALEARLDALEAEKKSIASRLAELGKK